MISFSGWGNSLFVTKKLIAALEKRFESFLLLISGTLLAVLEPISLVLVASVIQGESEGETSLLGVQFLITFFGDFFVGFVILVWIAKTLFAFVYTVWIQYFVEVLIKQIRISLFVNYSKNPIKFDGLSSGGDLSFCYEDSANFCRTVLKNFFDFFKDGLILLASIVVLFMESGSSGVIFVVLVVMYTGTILVTLPLISRYGVRNSKLNIESASVYRSLMDDSISLRALRRLRSASGFFARTADRYVKNAVRLYGTQQFPKVMFDILLVCSAIILISRYGTDFNGLNVTLLFLMIWRLFPTFARLLQTVTVIESNVYHVDRFSRVLDDKFEDSAGVESHQTRDLSFGQVEQVFPITISRQSIDYFGVRKTLEEFDLWNNEVIKVVGDSGSGKTVLLRRLLGLDEPFLICESGTVVSRTGIAGVTGATIAYLGQKPSLVSATILENLLLIPDVQYDRLDHRTQVAIVEFMKVVRLPVSESFLSRTILGGHSGVSGGQLQRLCLVRALLNKPSVLVIDEGLSGISTPLRREILDYLMKLPMSILLVSHGDHFDYGRTIKVEADRIGSI